VNSGALPASRSSYGVPALPAGTLYGTLYTLLNGKWATQEVEFTSN
jgi:hypothetical protein